MKRGLDESSCAGSGVPAQQTSTSRSTYMVGPILNACELLNSFRFPGESLFLRELVARTGLNKTTVFRSAETLTAGGLLERVARGRYAATMTPVRRRRFRIGYAAMSANSLFASEVTESLRQVAPGLEIELVEVNNQLSARVAICNSDLLVRERVDLAIEFQVCHEVAQQVSGKFAAAGIPMIAVHTPHPGATFFGGNNYVAGRIGGSALAAWGKKHWAGQVDKVLLLGHTAAGPLTNSRLTGMTVGIANDLPRLAPSAFVNIDCKGGYTEAVDAVFTYLARTKPGRTLVGAINDSVALGALRAFTEARREDACAIMSQNGTIGARNELRRANTPLLGSVAFYPEQYGAHLLPLAVSMLTQKNCPRAFFMKHELITAQNVDDLYPNDSLANSPDADSLLSGRYH